MEYRDVEKRQFLRTPYEQAIQYKVVFPINKNIVTLKLTEAISKNLSDSGILFTSKKPPGLSNVILLNLNLDEISTGKTIKEKILMLDGKPLGKVVRIEDKGNGEYDVGIAFITISKILAKDIGYQLINIGRYRLVSYFLIILFTLFVIFATLSATLIFVEGKETYQPNKNIYITPLSIGIKYEEVNFETEDGQTINGWFIPANGAKTTILYLRGRSGNICDELPKEKLLNSIGVNVFTFDYRGYGKSSGTPSEKVLYKDARAAYDYLISRNDINKERIVILGESLGGAIATDLCLNRKAAALVLESPVVSIPKQAKRLFPFLPTELLLFEKYDTFSKIKGIYIPKLIVHGFDDETVAFDDVISLFYAAPSPKQFLPFYGGHDDDMFKTSDIYKDKLIKFLVDNNL